MEKIWTPASDPELPSAGSARLSSPFKFLSAEEQEEADDIRYGLDDPERPHLSEAARRGEDRWSTWWGGGACRVSPSCVGVSMLGAAVAIFALLVCFTVLERTAREKEKLENLLRIAGGGFLVCLISLCCCNTCVCCKKNLSHRRASAPTFERHILDRKNSEIRRPSFGVPRIQVHTPGSASNLHPIEEFADVPSVVEDNLTCIDGIKTEERNESEIEEQDGTELEVNVDANGTDVLLLAPDNLHRSSVWTIDSYEIGANAINVVAGEDEAEPSEATKEREMQSLRMLGHLARFIEGMNGGERKKSDANSPKEFRNDVVEGVSETKGEEQEVDGLDSEIGKIRSEFLKRPMVKNSHNLEKSSDALKNSVRKSVLGNKFGQRRSTTTSSKMNNSRAPQRFSRPTPTSNKRKKRTRAPPQKVAPVQVESNDRSAEALRSLRRKDRSIFTSTPRQQPGVMLTGATQSKTSYRGEWKR